MLTRSEMPAVVGRQRTFGAISSFLLGLTASLLVLTYLKGKYKQDLTLVTIETDAEMPTRTPMVRDDPIVTVRDRSTLSDGVLVATDAVVPSPKENVLKLLILIFSPPDAQSMRRAVRSTWASDVSANSRVMHLFVVNVLRLPLRLVESLKEENGTHGDMVFLNEEPLLKTNSKTLLRALELVYENFRFKYLLKCNDASYVRVPEILVELEQVPDKDLIWGFFAGNTDVTREGPHAERTWNLCVKYLPYPQGGGYILSYDMVAMIVVMGPDLSHLDNDDIAIGVWFAPFNIQRWHDVQFNTGLESRGCNNTYLITHNETARSMEEKHQSLQKNGVLCTNEHQDVLSYVYDWSVPVSDCCIRKKGIP